MSGSCGSDAWLASDHADSSEILGGERGADYGFGAFTALSDGIPLLKERGCRVIEEFMPITTLPLHALLHLSKAGCSWIRLAAAIKTD